MNESILQSSQQQRKHTFVVLVVRRVQQQQQSSKKVLSHIQQYIIIVLALRIILVFPAIRQSPYLVFFCSWRVCVRSVLVHVVGLVLSLDGLTTRYSIVFGWTDDEVVLYSKSNLLSFFLKKNPLVE
jgi:uncharacterized membrane protein